jgi:hypothetical protein
VAVVDPDDVVEAAMSALASTRLGRVLLHLMCMARNRQFGHHFRGIGRELWRTAT